MLSKRPSHFVCLVNGEWSSPGDWTECHAGCYKIGYKTCTNPTPLFGGSDCDANDAEAYLPCTDGNCTGTRISGSEYNIVSNIWNLDCVQAGDCYTLSDYPGNNVANVAFEDETAVADCQERCQDNPDCNYFTLVFPPHVSSSCWLKSAKDEDSISPNELMISGPKHCPGKVKFLLILLRRVNKIIFYEVHGGWSEFGIWTMCSKSCETGQMKRYRKCNNPKPKYGGSKCQGPDNEVEECNTFSCDEGIINKCEKSMC